MRGTSGGVKSRAVKKKKCTNNEVSKETGIKTALNLLPSDLSLNFRKA